MPAKKPPAKKFLQSKSRRIATALAFIFVLIGGVLFAHRAATEQIIENYFRDNPRKLAEFLDNMQVALEVDEARARTAHINRQADIFYHNPRDISVGDKNAPITIVEYFDYNCGYCKRVFPLLMEVTRSQKDVRLVFKELPILNDSSRLAARWASAIKQPAQYLAFHSALMQNRSPITPTLLGKIAEDLGLDADAIARASRAKSIERHLQQTFEAARDIDLNGTPAFIINGRVYFGALSRESLEAALAQARAALKS